MRRALTPTYSFFRVHEIPLSLLKKEDIRLVLLDADNTAALWHGTTADEPTVQWIAAAREAGIEVLLFTNSKNPFVKQLIAFLGIPAVTGAGKPFPRVTRAIVESRGIENRQALIVGDQLFTDILLANRVGVQSVLTEPLSKTEWWCTKVFNRSREKIVGRR